MVQHKINLMGHGELEFKRKGNDRLTSSLLSGSISISGSGGNDDSAHNGHRAFFANSIL